MISNFGTGYIQFFVLSTKWFRKRNRTYINAGMITVTDTIPMSNDWVFPLPATIVKQVKIHFGLT